MFSFHQIEKFKSLKQITLRDIPLTIEKIACIKHILNKVEAVTLLACTVGGEFYDEFLRYCIKVKHLMLRTFPFPNPTTNNIIYYRVSESQPIIGTENSWLLREYPKLEYFGLKIVNPSILNLDELISFFQKNPNVRKFATNEDCIKMDWLVQAKMQVNDLAISNGLFGSNMFELLKLKEHFKRLQLYVFFIPHGQLSDFTTVKSLEKVYVMFYSSYQRGLLCLVNLKELCIQAASADLNTVVLASTLNNLERVSITTATFKDIEAFIVHAPKLNTLTIHAIKQIDDDITIDLVKWNRNRGHLAQARKVILFVDESVYLAVKWKTSEINYNLLELKRIQSCEWTHDFGLRS